MDLTLIWKTVLIGVVEGLTEFLPVSSTGHIILAEEILHFQGPPGKVFEIVIQLGAILAVCFLYRQKIFTTVEGVLKRDCPSLRFAAAIIVAFLPAAVIGVLAHKYIKSVLFSPWVAAGVCLLLLWMFSQMALLSFADLSYVLPVTSIGYVLSAVAGRVFLHEQISPGRWSGVFLIMTGVVLVGRTIHNTTVDHNTTAEPER